MARKIINQNNIHFLTMTIVGWVDVFSRKDYRDIVIDSLNYCCESKGLVINAFVIMSNHIHLIVSAKEGNELSNIIRDFKKFTSKEIVEAIINKEQESRKKWMLPIFLKFGYASTKHQKYQLWQAGNYPTELISQKWINQKLDYIHENPVKSGIVEKAEEYVYSSAKNYIGLENGILKVEIIDFGVSEGFVYIPS